MEDKVDIIQNAIDLGHALRFPEVRVAILSAMETVNPKVPSTVEAGALCKMADRGQITGAVLDGPLAPIPCASRTQYQECEDCDEATCQVRHMMLEVRQAIAEVLDNRSLAEMRDAANDDVLAGIKYQL